MTPKRLIAAAGALALVVVGVASLRHGSADGGRSDPGVDPPRPKVEVTAQERNLITWFGAAPGDSYRVFRSRTKAGPWQLIDSTGATATRDAPPGKGVYWYRVLVVDPSGTAGRSSIPVSSDHVDMTRTIGPRGGTLEPTTGTVRLEIPPGAVPVPTSFTIRQLPAPPPADPGHVVVTRVFDIGPNGTRFRRPATLTLRYQLPPQLRSSDLPADASVATRFWDPEADLWSGIRQSSVDEAASTITARIRHLSVWAAGSFTLPHGGYSSLTDLCASCHQLHDAPGRDLLAPETERETCYGCHDGTATGTDVRAEFGETVVGSSTRTSIHPVPSGTLLCSDCHTGHRSPAEDTKLLRVDDGGTYLYSPPDRPIGNAFCTTCHEQMTGFETAVHNTNPGVPRPASGTAIKCLACHQPHGSDIAHLTRADQEDLCYTCHTEAGFTAASNDYSTIDGNGIRVYHHPLATTEQDGGARTVECASCHDPHVVTRSEAYVDPANTTVAWTGDISSFCILCHAGPTVTQPITAGPTVPYTIRMVDDTPLDADGRPHERFSAAEWPSSVHAEAGLVCTDCHDAHGSSNAYILSDAGGTTGFTALPDDWQKLQTFCGSCHDVAPDHNAGQLCTECHSHGSASF